MPYPRDPSDIENVAAEALCAIGTSLLRNDTNKTSSTCVYSQSHVFTMPDLARGSADARWFEIAMLDIDKMPKKGSSQAKLIVDLLRTRIALIT
jgi:hypothetical protein